jgi:hypothetical protein
MTNIQLFSLSTNLFYLFFKNIFPSRVRDLDQIVLAFATQHEHPDPDQITEKFCQTIIHRIRAKICGVSINKKTPQFLVGFLLEF